MSKMVVFHGSYTIVQNPVIKSDRFKKDFGNGFYCTVIKEQAERWAKRFSTPMVNIYEIQINNSLKMEGIITREQFWVMAKFKYPTHQINFCTEEALKCLKYRDCQEVLK